MSNRLPRFAGLVLAFLAAVAPAGAATLRAVPASAGPGAMFVAEAGEVVPARAYSIWLERGSPFVTRTKLADFTASAEDVSRKLVVPETAPGGAHALVLYAGTTALDEQARTAFTVGTPLALSFSPASAEPGRAVQVTVTGVRAGTLQLDYAGARILGPVAVGDGAWTGKFIVPRDRPASLPATAKVVAINALGRFDTARGSAGFSALAPTNTPAIRASFTLAPPARTVEGSKLALEGRLQQRDGSASSGRSSLFWRGDNGLVVPIDGGVETDASGNYAASARAPGFLMDGIAEPGPGRVVSVTRDFDPDTDQPRDFSGITNATLDATGQFAPQRGQFVIRVRGRNQLNQLIPLDGVYVAAGSDWQGAFTNPHDGVAPTGANDFIGHDSQFAHLQKDIASFNGVAANGCPINFGAKHTNALGEAAFEVDKEALQHLVIFNAMRDLGEIRVTDHGAPVPGIDGWGDQVGNPGLRKGAGDYTEYGYVQVSIHAGVKGFGETGVVDDDGDPNSGSTSLVPAFEPTVVSMMVDLSNGAVSLQNVFGLHGAEGREVSPGVIEVDLPRIDPTQIGDVVPRNLRIAHLAGDGKDFGPMHVFDDQTHWPDAVFTQRNLGRAITFTWDAGFGAAGNPELWLRLPGQAWTQYGTFTASAGATCNTNGELEYSAGLPDLTRLPRDRCFQGDIVIRRQPKDAELYFTICTSLPPRGMRVTNAQLATLSIDARASRYSGRLETPQTSVTGNSAQMREYLDEPQENASNNDGNFVKRIDHTGALIEDFDVSTEHIVGNNGTEATPVDNPALFGFTGNTATRSAIERQTVLDTGRIPLFRYPWGFSPIAGAVLGADFWLGADVGFYGTLGNPGGGGTLMDATVDPRVQGGVDMFFDLDVLFGLVSASISALPSLDLTLKEVIGNGGLPDDEPGTCFGFDLDAELEVCALFCASDRFNLFRVQDGDSCVSAPFKLAPVDLPRPPLRPSAIAVAHGRELVVTVEASGELAALHYDTGSIGARRVIDARTNGVQHVTVAWLAPDRALAVWSENTRSPSELEALMTPTRAWNPVRSALAQVAATQVLNWSYFDGSAWSAPQRVAASQNGSVGKPQLAGCPSGFALDQCSPRAPQAYLAWEHDAAGDITAPSLEVWGARFTPATGFATAARLNTAVGTQDMHPDVAYLGREPAVAWVTSNGRSLATDTASRSLALRVLDRDVPTNPIHVVPGTSGAGWPAVATRGGGTVVLAFTRAQDDSLAGNRQALHAARGTCTDGVCNFQVTELRDARGRQLRGERPSITAVSPTAAAIQFRGLAFGPAANGTTARPDDPPGMLLGTGDLVGVRVGDFSRATASVVLQNLSGDGLVNFRPEFAFDAELDAFVGVSQQVERPAGFNGALDFAKRFAPKGFDGIAARKAVGDDGLVWHTLSALPDLRIESVALPQPWYAAGAAASYTVRIRNAGGDYDPALHGTAVLSLAWDAPPGAGLAVGSAVPLSTALAANASTTITRSFSLPIDHVADARRTLFALVEPPAATPDANGADNLATAMIGAMPVPGDIEIRLKDGLAAIGLDWADLADPRVAGYRVYKRAGNGEFVPYGSSQSSGYIDVFAGFRDVEEYRVTSYSANGIESEPSASVMGVPAPAPPIFDNGFE